MDSFNRIFRPKTVALIGATETEGSVGKGVMNNLVQGDCKVFPVNPKRETVFGIKAYPDVLKIPEDVDLAVIVTPAKTVPAIVQECVQKKIPAAVIISAGTDFSLIMAQKGNMRIIGPNCLGIMNPSCGLNATFASDIALDGNIAFISQSGALGTAVLDWSLKEKVGFSAFVSIGSMIDIDFGDLIEYFGKDPATKSILIYMESIGDAKCFLSAAKKVAISKPIILIKAGRTEEAAKAAASHTGALAGSDEVFSAAMRRVGVLRVDTIGELFAMTESLGKQPIPKGPHLTIVTNAGGPGVLATDALIANGGKLALISSDAMNAYNSFLPASWSHNNPIDILGDASPELYAKTLEIAANDPNTDGLLVILTPQDMTDPTKTAEELKRFAKLGKPVLASFMGAKSVEEGSSILVDAGIPVFEFPDMACKTFATMWTHSDQLKEITEEIPPLSGEEICAPKGTILDEVESKKILEKYQIPVVPTEIAKSPDEAVKIASNMGFPVVLKIYSQTITHKTDVGGVKLNLNTPDSLKNAYAEIFKAVKREDFQGVTVQKMVNLDGYELIIGSITDEEFGPVVLFGQGGSLVEVVKDQSLAMPTLTKTLALRLMRRTKIYEALLGVRGRKAVDIDKLSELLVRFSQMICEQTWIKECDINPLLVSPDGFLALDARIIVKQ